MAKITIKSSKPFVEQVIQGKLQGKVIKDNITVGVKLYEGEELEAVREDYVEHLSTSKVIRWQKQLSELPETSTLSDDAFDAEVERLEGLIKDWNKKYADSLVAFAKKHILFIKNASVTVELDGKSKDILITDTRDTLVIESLWETPEESLAVLLDVYLGHPAYKDSLLTTVPKLVFNSDIKDGELKN